VSRTTNLAIPDAQDRTGAPWGQAQDNPRRLWWLPPLLSCLAMIPLLPVGVVALVLALLATGGIARHIGAAMEMTALFFMVTQWSLAYWLPMPQRVVMACVPPVLAVLGTVVVL